MSITDTSDEFNAIQEYATRDHVDVTYCAEIIEKAADYFYNDGPWCRWKIKDEEGKVCALGAIQWATESDSFTQGWEAGVFLDIWLQQNGLKVPDKVKENSHRPIAYFNDYVADTKIDVADKMMECAKDLRNL